MADRAYDAALEAVREMVAAENVEGSDSEQEPASGTEVSAATEETSSQEAEEQEESTLDPQVPEEIQALVDEPDFEQEAEEQIAAEQEEWGEEEYADPRLVEEHAKRVAAEKRAAFLEGQRVKDARKAWEQEAAKFFPLANAKKIEATSRRSFLREAKRLHEETKPFVLAAIDKQKQELPAERERIREEERAKLEAAWGRPITGGAQVVEVTPEKQQKIEKAFGRNMYEGVREMLRQGE